MPCGSYQSRCARYDLADKCASFYCTTIECGDRDAGDVPDGLLHKESVNFAIKTEKSIALWNQLISNNIRSRPTYDWVGH